MRLRALFSTAPTYTTEQLRHKIASCFLDAEDIATITKEGSPDKYSFLGKKEEVANLTSALTPFVPENRPSGELVNKIFEAIAEYRNLQKTLNLEDLRKERGKIISIFSLDKQRVISSVNCNLFAYDLIEAIRTYEDRKEGIGLEKLTELHGGIDNSLYALVSDIGIDKISRNDRMKIVQRLQQR